MDGSIRSPYDNKEVWKKYNYLNLDIIAEPYFDMDFNKVLYLTDTGRRWDGGKMSIRDKVVSEQGTVNSEQMSVNEKYGQSFHSTFDIIEVCKNGELPDQIMFNFHPQRWTGNPVLWAQELVMQNVKNVVKRGLKKIRGL